MVLLRNAGTGADAPFKVEQEPQEGQYQQHDDKYRPDKCSPDVHVTTYRVALDRVRS